MKCPQCANKHELLEPAFRRPDLIAQLPKALREGPVDEDDDMCRMYVQDPEQGASYRYFLRAVLPVAVLDSNDFTQWGLWVEVSERDIYRVRELWADPRQAQESPFPGTVANQVPGYQDSIGLPVSVALREPPLRAALSFSSDIDHPFARECCAGVRRQRVLEWLRSMGVQC